MSSRKAWEPRIDREPQFNPFASVIGNKGALSQTPKLWNPKADTAPLQGSRDISDTDSLEDAIADAYGQHQLGTKT